MIGSAIENALIDQGYTNLVTMPPEPDHNDAAAVRAFFDLHRPEYVFVAAGRSGGIQFNRERGAELMQDNLAVAANILPAAHRSGVKKLLYLASSCVYPRECAQPMLEDSLMTGPLEATNEPYALAKLAGIKMCRAIRDRHGANFIAAIPTNIFGPGDRFDAQHSHVVTSLMRRMDEAKRTHAGHIDVWGTGTPQRELMPAADLADACIHVMKRYNAPGPINLGNGFVLSIAELAEVIRSIVGFGGTIRFDATRPDGMPIKVLDSSQLTALGWKPHVSFEDAVIELYEWYLKNVEQEMAETEVA